MKKQPPSVAPLSTATALFLGAPLLLGLFEGWLGLGLAIGTLGIIQIANALANHLPRPLSNLFHWIHSLTFEALALLPTMLLRPSRYFSKGEKGEGSRSGRPILLIHGYLHDRSAWSYLKRQWIKKGFGPIYSLNLGGPFRSIRDFALQVAKKAEEIERETKRQDLILIGHSMGGLVSSWYATKLSPPGKVTHVITIGSPLEGTHLAKIGLGPNAREMERDSPFLKDLREAIQKTAKTHFYHIGTKTDQIVVPQTSAIPIDTSGKQFILEDIGHVTLLFSPRVADQVTSWLQN